MKKTIALLLALTLCLSLCACGGGNDTPETKGNEENNASTENQNETIEVSKTSIDILGEWISVKNQESKLVFNEDGTCITVNNDVVKYTVDYDIGVISVYDSSTLNYNIIEENGELKLAMGSTDYVRAENYEVAHAEFIEQEISNFAKNYEGKTPIEFGTAYQFSDEFEITFLNGEFASHTTSQDIEIFGLWLTVSLRNLTDTTVEWHHYPTIAEGVCRIRTASSDPGTSADLNWMSCIDENGKKINSLTNEAATMMIPLAEVDVEWVKDSASYYGKVLGYATFLMGGVEYYIDFSQFPVNE